MFRILAAVDKSRYASVVMQTVARLASYVESDVIILSAVKPKRYRTTESAGEDEGTMREFHQELTHKFFPQKVLAVGAEPGGSPEFIPTQGATVHSRVIEGDPADTICRSAETMNADLVVVGKRGGGNIGALLLGSVSEKVVHKCSRSVLVAKEKQEDMTQMESSPLEQSHSRRIGHRC